MDHLIKAIDDLPDEEVIKLNAAIDDLMKVGENRVNAQNTGRYLAKCFVKCSSNYMGRLEDRYSAVPSFTGALTKLASVGVPVYATLANGAVDHNPGLEKLASATYYYRNGGRAFARIVDLIFNGV